MNESTDQQQRERLITAIMECAQPELQRRAASRGFGARLIDDVERRTRSLTTAAAAIALISTLAMMWFGLGAGTAEAQVPTLADALAPVTFAEWVASGELPAVSALILELEQGDLP